MTQQLYWFETLLKFAGGVVLLSFPVSIAKVLGLPHGNVGFWARLLGVSLIGMAGAIYIEASQTSSRGLGFAGLVAINISAILAMMSLLLMKQVGTVRGALALWLLIVVLLLLTMFEIAHV